MTKPIQSLLRWREIPAGVWALGIVSLLMDLSSEMIHALLPLYLVTVLGMSALTVGVIEGIAEATATIVRIFSGALSDRLGKRKLLAAAGYGLAALTRPVFPLATSVGWLVAARVLDRVGKGIRGAPRDALIADLAPPDLRGASFGLRQSLDTIGASLGPLLAIALMLLLANNFTAVFWIAAIPASPVGRGHRASQSAIHNARPEPGRCARRCRDAKSAASAGRTGWSSPSPPSSRSLASAKPSCCCAPNRSG